MIGAPNDPVLGAWAVRKIPHLVGSLGDFAGFGIVDREGVLQGVALYHNYAPHYRSIEITFGLESPRYLSKSVIAGVFAYPFNQLQLQRCSAVTPRSSASARRFLEKFGFRREGLIRLGFGDFGDAVVYGLTRKDWRESPFNPERAPISCGAGSRSGR